MAAPLRALSLGVASGEEPYTLRMIWRHELRDRFVDVPLHITATEVQSHMLRRAHRAQYAYGSLKNLPSSWIERAFDYDPRRDQGPHAEPYRLHPIYRRRLTFRREDLRATLPTGPFSIILCRNLAFTYFDESLQRWTLRRLLARLRLGGVLIIGTDETLPEGSWPLSPFIAPRVFRRKRTEHEYKLRSQPPVVADPGAYIRETRGDPRSGEPPVPPHDRGNREP